MGNHLAEATSFALYSKISGLLPHLQSMACINNQPMACEGGAIQLASASMLNNRSFDGCLKPMFWRCEGLHMMRCLRLSGLPFLFEQKVKPFVGLMEKPFVSKRFKSKDQPCFVAPILRYMFEIGTGLWSWSHQTWLIEERAHLGSPRRFILGLLSKLFWPF